MSNNEEALKLIRKGREAQSQARREKLWREIYGDPVLPEEFHGRPIGNLDESLRKGVLVKVLHEMQEEGLGITPSELARMVDMRLKRNGSAKPPTHKTIAAEIEATLDLIEHCQWRIALRRAEWKERAANWCKPYFESIVPVEEKAARERIEAQTYPIDFQKGLILIGVPGNATQRERAFWPFLHEQCVFSAMMRHQYGEVQTFGAGTARNLDDFIPPPESESRKVLERYKQEGWQDAQWLLTERELWQRHKLQKTKQKRSVAGKRSGEVRRPRAKDVGLRGKQP